jgi:cytochrome c oxidase assembly protein subunit 15
VGEHFTQRFVFYNMSAIPAQAAFSKALHRYAIVVVLVTLGLVGIGGLVTSHGVGMAVPDWPTSYGYNMFALPVSLWLTGGVFHEHTHRLWASVVGVLVVALTRWLGGSKSRWPLMIIGVVEIMVGQGLLHPDALHTAIRQVGMAEIVGGQDLLLLLEEWKGAGHFLSGIGGVVLLGGIVWVKNAPAARPLPALGWWAFWLVQLQGLLGGLRVVLDSHVFAGTRLGIVFGVFHGCLAQVFLVLLAVIALFTSRWWMERQAPARREPDHQRAGAVPGAPVTWLVLGTTLLVFIQLLIGATMRHQHAGLAIWDFPLAHGAWWPDMGAEAIQRYNATRIEVAAAAPITAFHVGLQMVHRLTAVAILLAVAACAWRLRGHPTLWRWGWLWLGMVCTQAALGAWTVWSHKAADVATLHVLLGALTLVVGALMSLIAGCFNFRCCDMAQDLASQAPCGSGGQPVRAANV